MNILYGVCGVGYGHATRTVSIVRYLESKGHKVIIVTHDQAYDFLKNKFQLFKIKGTHVVFIDGAVKNHDTLFSNVNNFFEDFSRIGEVQKLMKNFKPEICITDNEPFITYISHFFRIPLITIDNQHFLTNFNHNIPSKYHDSMAAARAVIKFFSFGARYHVVISFFDKKPKYKNTFIVPPIIRDEIKNLKPCFGKRILVYLSYDYKHVLEVLKQTPYEYDVYGYNIIKKDKNLFFKKPETFLDDLEKCNAIITTSGFSLISEAIFLKKPVFGVPFIGQFEQTLNAFFLKESGFGDYKENLNIKDVLNFIKNLPKYKIILKKNKSNHDKLYVTVDKVINLIKKKNYSIGTKFHHKVYDLNHISRTLVKTVFSKN